MTDAESGAEARKRELTAACGRPADALERAGDAPEVPVGRLRQRSRDRDRPVQPQLGRISDPLPQ